MGMISSIAASTTANTRSITAQKSEIALVKKALDAQKAKGKAVISLIEQSRLPPDRLDLSGSAPGSRLNVYA